MADYKGIQGYSVQSLASDPGTLADVVGQFWYNSGSNVWKVSVSAAGAWAAGGTMNRTTGGGACWGCGTTTATIAAGGYFPSYYTHSESYNGTAWANTNPLNDARYGTGMAGTSTAAIAIAGGTELAPTLYETASVETFDGTCWTGVTNITTRRGTGAGCGVQTAALFSGGNLGFTETPTWQDSALTEEWNGTAWSEEADLQTARNYACNVNKGTVTAALMVAGHADDLTPAVISLNESYNGTSWTEVNNTNTARNNGGGFGTSAAAMAFGGEAPSPPPTSIAEAELWDGTSWTEVANLPAANGNPGGSGATGTAGISIGGYTPHPSGSSYTMVANEWDGAPIAAKTVTTS